MYKICSTFRRASAAAWATTSCGVYLRGSLALGDFIPATSDVDVLAVTEQPVSELSTRNSSHCMQRWTLCPTPTPTVWR